MDAGFNTTRHDETHWIDRLTDLVETAHDGLVDLALDATVDGDLACTLGAVDLRDVLDDLRRHHTDMSGRLVRRPGHVGLDRSTDHGLPAVGGVVSNALAIVVTTAHDDESLNADELLLFARVAHGLARVLDRLGFPRP